jgi:hypothetical protein
MHHAMKTYGEMEVLLYALLTPLIDQSDIPTFRLVYLREQTPGP